MPLPLLHCTPGSTDTQHTNAAQGYAHPACLPAALWYIQKKKKKSRRHTDECERWQHFLFSRGDLVLSGLLRRRRRWLCAESPSAIWHRRSLLWANTRRVAQWHILMVWFNIGGGCKLGISLLHIHPFHRATPPTWLWLHLLPMVISSHSTCYNVNIATIWSWASAPQNTKHLFFSPLLSNQTQ